MKKIALVAILIPWTLIVGGLVACCTTKRTNDKETINVKEEYQVFCKAIRKVEGGYIEIDRCSNGRKYRFHESKMEIDTN